jgi:allophanate hydrolase subunit 2
VLPPELGTLTYNVSSDGLRIRSFVGSDSTRVKAGNGEGDGLGVGDGVAVGDGIGSADGINDV